MKRLREIKKFRDKYLDKRIKIQKIENMNHPMHIQFRLIIEIKSKNFLRRKKLKQKFGMIHLFQTRQHTKSTIKMTHLMPKKF